MSLEDCTPMPRIVIDSVMVKELVGLGEELKIENYATEVLHFVRLCEDHCLFIFDGRWNMIFLQNFDHVCLHMYKTFLYFNLIISYFQ